MNFRYDNWLINQLVSIQDTLAISDFKFEIAEEQDFLKNNFVVKSDTIFIVIKYLADTKSINSTVQPIQLIILCEENSLEKSKIIFNALAENNNWTSVLENTEFIKFQFSNPVVLSNFNEIGYGYRSVMYMTCNLYLMDDVLDFDYIEIDSVRIKPITISIGYAMTPNSQQKLTEYIASSVKSTSSKSISMTIASQNIAPIIKIINIMESELTGNEDFTIKYKFNGLETEFTNTMKLINSTYVTAPDNLPALNIGFIK